MRLFHTELSVFPHAVLRLKNLTELDFGDCKLKSLAEELGTLTKLRILRLDNNPLAFLPASIAALPLKELRVADNVIVKNEVTGC